MVQLHTVFLESWKLYWNLHRSRCSRVARKHYLKMHCVKIVCISSFSGPHFPAFELNTEIYSVSLRIQPKCGKIRIRQTPNMDTHANDIITNMIASTQIRSTEIFTFIVF